MIVMVSPLAPTIANCIILYERSETTHALEVYIQKLEDILDMTAADQCIVV